MTIDGGKERATRKDCLCHARPMLALRVLVDVIVVCRHLLMDLKLDRCRGRVRTVVERLFVPRSQSVHVLVIRGKEERAGPTGMVGCEWRARMAESVRRSIVSFATMLELRNLRVLSLRGRRG